jgi:hypothetical protein
LREWLAGFNVLIGDSWMRVNARRSARVRDRGINILVVSCGKPLSQTIKKNSPLDRLSGFSSRYECEENAKIVWFFHDSK